MKTYNELITINDFLGRYRYLRLRGRVGVETFGFERYLNQIFYKSDEWLRMRDIIIIRDDGCDLGIQGFEIHGRIYVHHIEPITPMDLQNRHPKILDPNNLITTSYKTHQAIHYGDENLLSQVPIERRPNDTIPWLRGGDRY